MFFWNNPHISIGDDYFIHVLIESIFTECFSP